MVIWFFVLGCSVIKFILEFITQRGYVLIEIVRTKSVHMQLDGHMLHGNIRDNVIKYSIMVCLVVGLWYKKR